MLPKSVGSISPFQLLGKSPKRMFVEEKYLKKNTWEMIGRTSVFHIQRRQIRFLFCQVTHLAVAQGFPVCGRGDTWRALL